MCPSCIASPLGGHEVADGRVRGCSLQIAAHSERLGRRLRLLHPMELLRMSIEGGADDDGRR